MEECKGEVSEFAEIRLEVQVQNMLECQQCNATWPQGMQQVYIVNYNKKGRAMNTSEMLESVPQFLASAMMEILTEKLQLKEDVARELLAREFDHRV